MKEDIRRPEKSEAAILAEELQQSVRQAGLAAAEEPREPGKEGSGSAEGTGREKKRRSRSRAAFKARQEALVKGGRERSGEESAGGEGSPGKKFPWKPALCVFLALAAAGGFYLYKAMSFKQAYLPHTVINGMDVTGKTADQVKERMAAGVKDYEMSLLLRGDGRETIKGDDFGLHTVFDGSLEEIIRQQNPYAWPRYLLRGPSYEIQA